MKKHFRRLIAVGLGLGISLTGVSTAFAVALNYSVDTTVTVNNSDYTILAGSAATTVTIGNTTLTVTVPAASTFTLRSSDRFRLSNDQGLTQTCTGTKNDVVVTGPATVIFTLSPFLCSSSSSSGSSGGGGGGTTTLVPGLIAPPGTVHPAGSVVKTSDGTVWFITNTGQRRAFTSGGAFLSYGFLNFSQVVDANSGDMALPAGPFIAPRDGSVFCATETKDSDVKGECALITGGMKAAFTSAAVFNGQGFSFSNVQSGDSSFLVKTSNITSAAEAHRPGVLVNNKGTVQLVGQSSLLGIPSMAVFDSWGYNDDLVVPANIADKLLIQSGVMISRTSGQLNP